MIGNRGSCSVVCSSVVCIVAAADSFDVRCGGLYDAGSSTAVPAVGNSLCFSGIGCLFIAP